MYKQMQKRERPLFVLPGLFPNYFSLKKTSLSSPSLFLSQFPHRPSRSEKQESELVDVGSSVLDNLTDLYLKKLWHQPSRATKVHCSHNFQVGNFLDSIIDFCYSFCWFRVNFLLILPHLCCFFLICSVFCGI